MGNVKRGLVDLEVVGSGGGIVLVDLDHSRWVSFSEVEPIEGDVEEFSLMNWDKVSA